MLDFFPLPAFLIPLDGLLRPAADAPGVTSLSNDDLPHRMSTCYVERTARMPSNYFHHELLVIFYQTLAIADHLRNATSSRMAPDPSSTSITNTHPSHKSGPSLSTRAPLVDSVIAAAFPGAAAKSAH
ncbi:hypothetical protein P168DRAFT_317635 [Aspergillus campestris IBT 28561]|uniref:Uncharacterized protein n=1 Tax=Aspergillus campestris (strain IBT 28561) TaxID=1392248 RepID=A0A2I1D8D2_ASPC2|nr:uncharacterized protein P168DRAFT_317635 [Aspergillus campestris IBT 28561]PKY06142.1 hypothetical protein P168DRAFT_317635 [Aspergillus campestris IBT 28561]